MCFVGVGRCCFCVVIYCCNVSVGYEIIVYFGRVGLEFVLFCLCLGISCCLVCEIGNGCVVRIGDVGLFYEER